MRAFVSVLAIQKPLFSKQQKKSGIRKDIVYKHLNEVTRNCMFGSMGISYMLVKVCVCVGAYDNGTRSDGVYASVLFVVIYTTWSTPFKYFFDNKIHPIPI